MKALHLFALISLPSIFAAVALAQAPANDAFVTPVTLAAGGGTLAVDTTLATREPGEPVHNTDPASNSLWFAWTAPQTGLVQITATKSGGGFARLVYTGDALANLGTLVSVHGGSGVPLVFNASAGVTYRVMIGSIPGAGGPVSLSWGPTALVPVAIASHPANAEVGEGGPATFSVTATGTGPLTYQWYRQPVGQNYYSVVVADATYGGVATPTLTVGGVTAAMNGERFYCSVSSASVLPGTGSAGASLSVLPVITSQPANQIGTAGGAASFAVGASGSNLTYQWYRNGAPLAEATNATLALANLQLADVGSYYVRVSNGANFVTSTSATLTGSNTPPTISAQPVDVAAVAGQPATFSVAATGSGALAYQWRRNGFPIAGANAASFTIATSSRTDADFYDAVVADGLAVTTLVPVRLDVAPSVYPGLLAADPTWNLALESPNAAVNKVLPLADGKFLVAGDFIKLNGLATGDVARFNADGTVDPSFVAPVLNGYAKTLAVQADGKVLVGGSFTVTVGSTTYSRLIRLNGNGSFDATFNPGGSGPTWDVWSLVVAPDAKIYVAGVFAAYNGVNRSYIARLHGDGTLDTTFNAQANNTVYAVALQPDGKLVIGGYFTTVGAVSRSRLARLNADGSLDPTFDPGTGADTEVYALAVAADGKIYAGGYFSTYNGTAVAPYLRLNANGSLDPAFVTSNFSGNRVESLAVQSDGKLLVGGLFYTIRGVSRSHLARVTADGALDLTGPQNANSTVLSVAVAADGKILAGGYFSSVDNVSRQRVARIAADGTLDASVAPTLVQLGNVRSITQVPGGKLAIAGDFTTVNGTARNNLAQLNADGSLDLTFDPGSGASANLTHVVRQPDGRLVVAGYFNQFNGQSRPALARLLADGTLDPTFAPTSAPAGVEAVALTPGGGVVLGGGFWFSPGNVTYKYLVRYAADGALDTSFVPNPDNSVRTVAPLADGRLLVGGYFTSVGGATRNRIARLNADGTADPTFDPGSGASSDVTALALLPGGGGYLGGAFSTYNGNDRYMFARIGSNGAFDSSFGRAPLSGWLNNTPIGQIILQNDGKVIVAGGLSALTNLPSTRYLARLNADGTADATFGAGVELPVIALSEGDDGRLYVGTTNGLVRMTAASVPSISAQPVNATTVVGGTATFSVTASGLPAPTYQWTFNGNAIAGATSASLTLTNAQRAQVGSYAVTVSNSFGSVTSTAVTLGGSAPAPTVTAQPADVTATAGQPATFGVAATGTGPLVYQWRRGGVPIAGATEASYTIAATTLTDAGRFDVLVYDGLTAAVSAAARLTVVPSAYAGIMKLDPTFAPRIEAMGGEVYAAVRQPDGKFIIGGRFDRVGGVARTNLARLNADGSIDASFDPGKGPDQTVRTLVLQADGRVLVGGEFSQFNGQPASFLIRLLADGSIDSSFAYPSGMISSTVAALVVQPDGRILVGGYFYGTTTGVANRYLVRLNVDGTRDASFATGNGFNNSVTALARLADGRLLVAGSFSDFNGTSRVRLARLNADGSLDASFDAGTRSQNSSAPTVLLVQADGKIVLGSYGSSNTLVRVGPDGGPDPSFQVGTGFNSDVLALAQQADGKLLVGGWFYYFNGGGNQGRLARLNTDGSLDATLATNGGPDSGVRAILALPAGQILAAGSFQNYAGVSQQAVVRLNSDGSRDATLAVAMRRAGTVVDLVQQPGGKLVVAGYFDFINDVPTSRLARLNADGSVDATFNPGGGGPNSDVQKLALQPDGKLVIAGYFGVYNGVARPGLARLSADGVLDPSFAPVSTGSSIRLVALSPDGRVVGSGYNSPVGGERLWRFGFDGSVDGSFGSGTAANNSFAGLAIQPDGQAIVAGYFTTVGGVSRSGFARFAADGTLDTSFNSAGGYSSNLQSLSLLDGGKMLVGSYGTVYSLGGTQRSYVARANADGSIDASFTAAGPTNTVLTIQPQADGRLLLGGYAGSGSWAAGLCRVQADGGFDPTFGVIGLRNSQVNRYAQLDDGSLYLAGYRFSDGTTTATGVVRVIPATVPNDAFANAITLAPGGGSLLTHNGAATHETGEPNHSGSSGNRSLWFNWTAPSAGTAVFETAGSDFSPALAAYTGTSVASLTPVSTGSSGLAFAATSGTTYRIALDSYSDASFSGTINLAWSLVIAPTIATAPVAQVSTLGGGATFSVAAGGSGPVSYQWKHDGSAIAGATGATLTLGNLTLADAGTYTVTITNRAGTVTSAPVLLSGANPVPTVTASPVDAAVAAGQSVTFSVTATGTGTLAYQWRRNGFAIAGATTASYAIPSASRTDTDFYDVLISDGLSATIATAARLDVAPSAYPGYLTLDPAWNVSLETTNGVVNKVLPLANGQLLVAGDFIRINGHPTGDVARFNADGTIDPTFVAPILNGYAKTIAVQSDGKVLVGGSFTLSVGSTTYNRLIRLNADGALDATFNPGGSGPSSEVRSLAVAADGRIYLSGSFNSYNGTTQNYVARLNADGTLDAAFAPAVSSTVLSLALQTDGKLVIGGYFSTIGNVSRSRIARLNADGTLDTSFDPGTGPNSDVLALALAADGKIYAGGWFSAYNGTSVAHYLRLTSTGALDPSFVTTGFSGNQVESLFVQSDGKLLIGGQFYTIRNTSRNHLARVTTDGTLDSTPAAVPNSTVLSVAAAADGKIVAGGMFTTVDVANRQRLVRLASDGTIDPSLAPTLIQQGNVRAMALVPGGKLAIAGDFTSVNGTACGNVAQLNADGTLDPSFNAGTGSTSNTTQIIRQPDGKLIVAGYFFSFNGASRTGLVRLLANGAVDPTFIPGSSVTGIGTLALTAGGKIVFGAYYYSNGTTTYAQRLNADGSLDAGWAPGFNGNVYQIAPQPDGKVLFGGNFTNVNGTARSRIARLMADGAIDPSFDPGTGASSEVTALTLLPGGNIWIGGSFSAYNGTSRYMLARILGTGALDTTFAAAPFAGWSNWPSIAQAIPQQDGKVIVAGSLSALQGAPATQYLARINAGGTVDATFGSTGLAWPVAALAQLDDGRFYVAAATTLSRTLAGSAPAIGTQPVNVATGLGGAATFSVTATGLPAPTYQWTFNGIAIPGATSSSLTLSDVQLPQAGRYAVIVTNAFGSVTSAVANLGGSAPPPTITTQPVDVAVVAGQPATLTVAATGTGPLTYQWRRNGLPIAGATAASYAMAATSRLDADFYDVVLADGLSITTSTAARLDVAPSAYPGLLAIDPTWNVALESTGATVYKVLPLAGGGFLVGGDFAKINGHATGDVARLKADGTIDASFAAPVLNGYAKTLAVQADGKILVGGSFTLTTGGNTIQNLIRLNADGSLDPTFNPGGAGPNSIVTALALAADGRIFVGGSFVSYNGVNRSNLARLKTDGTLDSAYTTVASSSVSALLVQDDGKLVVGGSFSTIAGIAQNRIARLKVDGSLDTTFAVGTGASDVVTSLALAADGKIYASGWFGGYNGTSVGRYMRLNADGSLDPLFVTSDFSGSRVDSLFVQSDGKVLLGGSFSSVRGVSRSYLARVGADGSLDSTLASSFSSTVGSVAQTAEGKVVVAGFFSTVNATNRTLLARLATDGTLDATLDATFRQQGRVAAMAALPGGKLAIVGDFITVNGTARNYVAQLNADGTLDTSFDPGIGPSGAPSLILRQPDGRLLVSGFFGQFNGVTHQGLVRLLADGSFDPSFAPVSPPTGLSVLALTPGGQIVIGGSFSNYSFGTASPRAYLARLNADGTLDLGWAPLVNGTVYTVSAQPDGRLVVGGTFSTVNGTSRNRIARLNADGTLDATFDPGTGLNSSRVLATTQPGGKLWVAGDFSTYNGTTRSLLARVMGNGSLDSTFANAPFTGYSFSPAVAQILPQNDGRVIVAGGFNALTGAPATRFLTRVKADGTVDPTLGIAGLPGAIVALAQLDDGRIYLASSTLLARTTLATAPVIGTPPVAQTGNAGDTLTLSVTAAAVGPVTYQWSRDGVAVPGATGATLTLANVNTAAAGSYTVTVTSAVGAGAVTSTAVAVVVNGPPTGTAQTAWQKVFAGSDATFSVRAATATSYQWQRSTDGGANWSPLIEGTPFSGVATATLTVQGVNAGMNGWLFRATASNSYGSITSDALPLSTVPTPSTPGVAWLAAGGSGLSPALTPKAIAGAVTDVSAGTSYTLFVKSDGTLWATGNNYNGQLGDGTAIERHSPVQVATGVARVVAGSSHTMFIKTDGTLWGMGSNGSHQLSNDASMELRAPVKVPGAANVTAVAVGNSHTLFLQSGGTLWAMGNNSSGQLGDGTTTMPFTPIQIATGVTAIAAGLYSDSSYFIKSDASLWSMGNNYGAQLGDGTTVNRTTPVQVATDVASVGAANGRLLYVKTDGTLWGVGNNASGALGDGTTTDRTTPVQIASGVASVEVGGSHTLFRKTDGTLWGMGYNGNGQLNDGTLIDRKLPVQVGSEVTKFAAGGGATFFLKADGILRALGSDGSGELGDGQIAGVAPLATGVTRAAASGFATGTLAVKADGTLWRRPAGAALAQVAGVSGVVDVVARGYGQSDWLYLKADGTLWTLAADDVSTQVTTGVISAGGGLNFFVCLKSDGTLWGQGTNGPILGDGKTLVPIADHVLSIAAAGWHFLYVTDDHKLWGMGMPWGGFGLADSSNLGTSTPIQLETDVSLAAATGSQNVWIKTDGTLWTRGMGWADWTGPAVQVDTGVTGAAAYGSGAYYLKADGVLRFRSGTSGTLGAIETIADGVTAVRSVEDAVVFLQTTGVGTAPAITQAPQSAAAVPGAAFTLTAAASGSGPVGYQWFKDGVAISGAHAKQFTIPYATAADAGLYTVTATNSAGSITSAAATVTVGSQATVPDFQLRNPQTTAASLEGGMAYGNGTYAAVTLSGAIWSSADGIAWTQRFSGPNQLNAIAFAAGQFVAVGRAGTLLTSPDGTSWTQRVLTTTTVLTGVVHDGTAWLVATGGGTLVITSPDGVAWTASTTTGGGSTNAVAFGAGLYVAVGGNGAIATSPDGITWTGRASGTSSNFQDVFFGNGLFVAVGGSGAIATSPDGIAWTSRVSGTTNTLWGAAFGAGKFVIAAGSTTVLSSPDGVSWTQVGIGQGTSRAMVFGGGQFVSGGLAGFFVTSPDGLTWTARQTLTGRNLVDVAYGNGRYVAVSSSNTSTFLTSSDAVNWTLGQNAGGLAAAFHGVGYGHGLFTAVGVNAIATTTDGIAWVNRSPSGSFTLNGVAHGGGVFVAVGNAGVVYRATDGANWSPVSAGLTDSLIYVAYGAGVFSAVSSTGNIFTSPDGLNWTRKFTGSSALNYVRFANGRFVAVGADSTVLTSPDGDVWSRQTVDTTNVTLTGVAFGDGIYLAVPSNFTTDFWVSSDAATWTKATLSADVFSFSSPAGQIPEVTYGNGRFVLIGAYGLIASSIPAANTLAITAQPLGGEFASGQSATLAVNATGAGLSYQWYRGVSGDTSNPIVGATATGYTTPALTASAQYWVRIASSAGASVDSATATLLGPPAILVQPQSRTIAGGGSVTFTVEVDGPAPFTYQWKKDDTAINGATSATLTLSNVQAGDAGSYTVVVTNSLGSVTSTAATLTVNAPVATRGLVTGSARAGAGTGVNALSGAFTVEGATSKQMLIRVLGPALTGFGVNGVLADPQLQIVNAMTGAVVATNDDWSSAANAAAVTTAASQVGASVLTAGSKDAVVLASFAPGTYRADVVGADATTGTALLEIYDADTTPRLVYLATRAAVVPGGGALVQGFVVQTPPAGRSYLIRALGPTLAIPGALADPQLSVSAGGTTVASNDNWAGDSTVASLATGVGAMPLPAGNKDAAVAFTPTAAGVYTVTVSGVGDTGGVCLLEIFEADALRADTLLPAIVSHPVSQTVGVGQPVTLGVVTVGKPAPTYQWFKNSGVIPGATGARLTLDPAATTDTGFYQVAVSNSVGSATSAFATLTVSVIATAPAIATPPASVTIASGQSATLSVTATGTAPLSYQWYQGESGVTTAAIAGATNASFATPALTATAAYWVRVTNTAGTADSVTATVTVLSSAGTTATHAVAGFGYVAGRTVTITNTITYTGTADAIGWAVTLPAGWTYAGTGGTEVPGVKPRVGDTGSIAWAYTDMPASPATFTYTVNVPAGETARRLLSATLFYRAGGNPEQAIPATPGPLTVAPAPSRHSADLNQDGALNLSELLRVIELYNTRHGSTRTGRYLVQSSTEDGFASDPLTPAVAGVTLSLYHSADTTRDGQLGLSELLRVIELYNYRSGTTRTGQYRAVLPGDTPTEDGFTPGL